jgi:hypothetical protein
MSKPSEQSINKGTEAGYTIRRGKGLQWMNKFPTRALPLHAADLGHPYPFVAFKEYREVVAFFVRRFPPYNCSEMLRTPFDVNSNTVMRRQFGFVTHSF